MIKTEFFETAVEQGFYGVDKGGLFGKKDNVRKYWEDLSVKILMKPPILELLNHKEKIRIVDFGCGSGEGYELITHISPIERPTKRDFLLTPEQIEIYLGMDISKSMIDSGKSIYSKNQNMKFIQADLSKEYPFLEEEPFDIYMSTYSSPSHLTVEELGRLVEKVFQHTSKKSYLVLDLFGKYSPEWPCYWDDPDNKMSAYNMAWLHLPDKLKQEDIEPYYVKYWERKSLIKLLTNAASVTSKRIKIMTKDRSILVGRHIDTGFFNSHPQSLRYQVNRLFDRDYEGRVDELKADISFLKPYINKFPETVERINCYLLQWNTVVNFCEALIKNNNDLIKKLIESTDETLSEELKMLAWLFRNRERFPVDNFWASVMGPQLACVLRNLELNLPEGIGCGHGLFCIVEIN